MPLILTGHDLEKKAGGCDRFFLPIWRPSGTSKKAA